MMKQVGAVAEHNLPSLYFMQLKVFICVIRFYLLPK